MRGENCHCHNRKTWLHRLCGRSHAQSPSHSHPHTHMCTHTPTQTALIHLPKTCTLLLCFFFFALIAPINLHDLMPVQKEIGWQHLTSPKKEDDGESGTTDVTRWGQDHSPCSLAGRGGWTPSPRASWLGVWSQEVRFLVSLQWADWLFCVSTGRWREVSWRASGLGRSSRWAWALESAGSSSGRSTWLPSHPEHEQQLSECSPNKPAI